eukprot:COSAG02_NODE_330_length_24501_cov_39.465850_18_plen_117_part_00
MYTTGDIRHRAGTGAASASACDRVDGMSFLPHLRVCAPERRENVLRLQEPKNEQKRLKEGKPQRPAAPPNTGNRSIGSKLRQSPLFRRNKQNPTDACSQMGKRVFPSGIKTTDCGD